MSTKIYFRLVLLSASILIAFSCTPKVSKGYEAIKVDYVPSSFPVNFSLITTQEKQYVAYYDSSHILTMATRGLNENQWEYKKLDSKVEWDSHNYLSLFIDTLGYIHLSGNMHSSPLNYFKSTKPYDIQSMERIPSMVGDAEDVTTYPKFLIGNNQTPVFHYRYGRSGNGYEVYNHLDVPNQEWKRLLSVPLLDGEGLMNAYMKGPIMGPDGNYHLIWVWRDTPDCSTNHTLSYAKSKDLIHWESVKGDSMSLPLTIHSTSLYVDTTKPKGGLLNVGIQIGFNSKQQPIIFYHKYDEQGNTQLYLAQYNTQTWESTKLTNWEYRWDFKGMGSIKAELMLDAPIYEEGTGLILGYHHYEWGDKQLIVSENDFSVTTERNYLKPYPEIIDTVQSKFPGMMVNKVFDNGANKGTEKYLLRWETLRHNRDLEMKGEKPQPTILEVVKY